MRILSIILLQCLLLPLCYSQQQEALATISFINVGEGDSTLIQSQNQSILIDTGNLITGDKVRKYLDNNSIKNLNRIIFTHPHADHIGGAFQIVQNFNFEHIHDNAESLSNTHEDIYRWYSDLVRIDKKYAPLSKGDKFQIGNAKFHVLAPKRINMTKDWNTNSLVLLISIGDTRILMMGDGNFETEKILLEDNVNIKSDILKVGHHAASDSSATEFLNYVKPKFSVVSVNQNNIRGYPSKDSINRLSSISKVLRTDEQGNIIIDIYPNGKIQIRGEK
jgi:competence protein ComEC